MTPQAITDAVLAEYTKLYAKTSANILINWIPEIERGWGMPFEQTGITPRHIHDLVILMIGNLPGVSE